MLYSCTHQNKEAKILKIEKSTIKSDSVIIDCNYSFEEAIQGTRAPIEIVNQLKLINVRYYSTDKKIHQGQVLTNSKIADKIVTLFNYILYTKFPVAHAIPIVKYNWNDELSMQANNTYSFCYRNEGFSKHALGMAIDINPYFNPLRWKDGYENRLNKPLNAHYDPAVPGTFYKLHPVVQEFRKLGFYWGHNFTVKYDDHHFEI
jgi:hypothetical protein